MQPQNREHAPVIGCMLYDRCMLRHCQVFLLHQLLMDTHLSAVTQINRSEFRQYFAIIRQVSTYNMHQSV